jgi:hypothetical protein
MAYLYQAVTATIRTPNRNRDQHEHRYIISMDANKRKFVRCITEGCNAEVHEWDKEFPFVFHGSIER